MAKYLLQEMNDVRSTGKRTVYPKMVTIIDEKGHITLGEYAKVNNLSRTTASKELAKISSDPNMPIDYTGQASHKIWIRRKGVNC